MSGRRVKGASAVLVTVGNEIYLGEANLRLAFRSPEPGKLPSRFKLLVTSGSGTRVKLTLKVTTDG